MALARGTMRLESYKEAWVERFEDEADRLRAIFGDRAPIEHIGSTAIPGMMAKPIIDMMVGVESLDVVSQAMVAKLENMGYRSMPDRVTQDEIFMPKGPDSRRTHYLHIVPRSNRRWHNTVLFRNYLRAHPAAREEYADLKRKLAIQYPDDRASYTDAKTGFVADILRRATQ
ncbi:GrpB family protein [Candidatus Saccharibacteria bacterium]|nr:MAG: GrpB family protein [Candidatus Saccharibacteria bacterium]